jgi:hypothetical protein
MIVLPHSPTADKRAANDKRVAGGIRKYGCHVISVFDPAGKQPFFSYSVGIQETSGALHLVQYEMPDGTKGRGFVNGSRR